MSYPEHAKLKAVRDETQAIGEFIDWLADVKKLHLADYPECTNLEHPDCDECRPSPYLYPSTTPTTTLLAEFYRIDLDLIEKEKRQMLALLGTPNRNPWHDPEVVTALSTRDPSEVQSE